MRKLRRLTIDVSGFLRDYHDAVESGITVREFCEVTGLHIATLHGRIETLAKRGVILPLLKGMRKKSRMGRRLMGIEESKSTALVVPKPVVVDAVAVEPVEQAPPPVTQPLVFTVCVGTGF